MRNLRLWFQGTSPLEIGREAAPTASRALLKAVETDVYGKLARRRRKAQMAARRALGVHDDLLSRQSLQG
jgi:hypothetical protein